MLALIWGLASFPAAMICLVAALFAAQLVRQPKPQPIIDNEDQLSPDSWWDVAVGLIATPTLLVTTAGLLVAFAALLAFAGTGRWPASVARHRRGLFRLAGLCLTGLALLFCAYCISAISR